MNFKISFHLILSLECIRPRLCLLFVSTVFKSHLKSLFSQCGCYQFGMYLGPFVYHFRVCFLFFFLNLLLPFEYVRYIAQKEKPNVTVYVEILFSSSYFLFPPCFPIDNHFFVSFWWIIPVFFFSFKVRCMCMCVFSFHTPKVTYHIYCLYLFLFFFVPHFTVYLGEYNILVYTDLIIFFMEAQYSVVCHNFINESISD